MAGDVSTSGTIQVRRGVGWRADLTSSAGAANFFFKLCRPTEVEAQMGVEGGERTDGNPGINQGKSSIHLLTKFQPL